MESSTGQQGPSTVQRSPSDAPREPTLAPESQQQQQQQQPLPMPGGMQQAYVPHQAYQYPPQPQQQLYAPAPAPGPHQPRLVPFTKSWHIGKAVLRFFDIISSVVVIALTLWLVSVASYRASLPLILSLPPACLCVLWEVAEFITLCARGGKLGIHPGAHVGVHLCIWLYWAVGIALLCVFSIIGYGELNPWISIEAALLAFSIIASLLNFTLFVRGCVEVNQRNRQRGQIFVMSPNGAGQFYVLAPQQQGQLPQMQQYQHPAMPAAVYPPVAPRARDSKAPVSAEAPPPSIPVMSPADGSFYGPGNPHQHQA